jgi:hypothetical protein
MSARENRRLLAVAVAVALMVPPGVGANDGETRPFRMVLQGHASPDFPPEGCFLTNSESGTGIALHLGALTWASNEIVNFCAEGGPVVEGEFVLTAADGDQLFGHLRTIAQFDFVTNQITFSGTWQITGGTGRFQGASGEGELSGQGSLVPPFDVTSDFSGEISY